MRVGDHGFKLATVLLLAATLAQAQVGRGKYPINANVYYRKHADMRAGTVEYDAAYAEIKRDVLAEVGGRYTFSNRGMERSTQQIVSRGLSVVEVFGGAVLMLSATVLKEIPGGRLLWTAAGLALNTTGVVTAMQDPDPDIGKAEFPVTKGFDKVVVVNLIPKHMERLVVDVDEEMKKQNEGYVRFTLDQASQLLPTGTVVPRQMTATLQRFLNHADVASTPYVADVKRALPYVQEQGKTTESFREMLTLLRASPNQILDRYDDEVLRQIRQTSTDPQFARARDQLVALQQQFSNMNYELGPYASRLKANFLPIVLSRLNRQNYKVLIAALYDATRASSVFEGASALFAAYYGNELNQIRKTPDSAQQLELLQSMRFDLANWDASSAKAVALGKAIDAIVQESPIDLIDTRLAALSVALRSNTR